MPVQTTVTELPDSRVRLDAEVPSAEIESRLERAAAQLGQEMRIPGFRKGKVPGSIVIQKVGREGVLEQAVRDSLPEWYEQAILNSGVSTVGDPKLSLDDMPAAGQPLRFAIEVAVTPKAKLGKYKQLEVGKGEPEVSDETVDHELGHLREGLGRLETVDREAKSGDFLVMDFVGKVGGEPFEGGEARDYLLELGSNRLVDGFEEQLVGAKAGSSVAVEVEFPADYRAEDLAGKQATFDVDVKEVKEQELPELDDDFASEASEFETLEQLRADIREKLGAAQQRSIDDAFRGEAVDAAVAEATVELTDELVRARAEEMWTRTQRALERQGVDAETYLRASDRTAEQMVEEAMPDAAQALAREAVLEAVAEAEQIEVSDAEIMEALAEMGGPEGANPADMLEQLRAAGRDGPIRQDLRLRKAVDVLAGSAVPIELSKAKAREAIWTPDKDAPADAGAADQPEPEAKPGKLWTPGDD